MPSICAQKILPDKPLFIHVFLFVQAYLIWGTTDFMLSSLEEKLSTEGKHRSQTLLRNGRTMSDCNTENGTMYYTYIYKKSYGYCRG